MSGADTTLDPRIISMLRCPMTGRPLSESVRDGRRVLTTDDGRVVYEIRSGVPILLPADRPGATVKTTDPAPPASA